MSADNRHLRNSGKTVINTLVAVATVVLLLVLLVPVLTRSRTQARSYVCVDNLKQLTEAAQQYAVDNKGRFFPQSTIYVEMAGGGRPEPRLWCDNKRLGLYTDDVRWETWEHAKHKGQSLKVAVNGIVRCPQADDKELRSYEQNHWANGLGLVKYKDWRPDVGPYTVCVYGDHFDVGSDKLDQLMLFVESNAAIPRGSGWVTKFAGLKGRPSDRFNGGVRADADYRRHLHRDIMSQPRPRYTYIIPWDIDYSRHGSVNNPLVAKGETNISFADGHVAGFSNEELYDPVSLTSTYNALWSTTDRHYDEAGESYEKPDQ